MKVSQAVDFHTAVSSGQLEKNTVKTCEFFLSPFVLQFGKRDLASIGVTFHNNIRTIAP